MNYWSEEKKEYIRSLTKKKVLFAGITDGNKINLKIDRDNYDLIFAVSKKENFYIALDISDYLEAKTVNVSKKLLDMIKNIKFRKMPSNSLTEILRFPSMYKKRKSYMVYIPPNDRLVEQFFSNTRRYFDMED